MIFFQLSVQITQSFLNLFTFVLLNLLFFFHFFLSQLFVSPSFAFIQLSGRRRSEFGFRFFLILLSLLMEGSSFCWPFVLIKLILILYLLVIIIFIVTVSILLIIIFQFFFIFFLVLGHQFFTKQLLFPLRTIHLILSTVLYHDNLTIQLLQNHFYGTTQISF